MSGDFAISFGDGVVDALVSAMDAIGTGWVVRLEYRDGQSKDIEIGRWDDVNWIVYGFEYDSGAGVPIRTAPVAVWIGDLSRIHVY